MASAESKRLRERWSDADTLRINQLLKTGQISASGLPMHDVAGIPYVDLRGLQVTHFIKGVTLSNIDFSFGRRSGAGQFGLCDIRTCLFIAGEFGANLSQTLVSCDFTEAKLQRATFFGEFRDCNFSRANLSNTIGSLKFINCSFRDANLKGAHLTTCVFDRCGFTGAKFGDGSFAFSTIIGVKQSEVDFKDTLLEDVTFQ
jgi:uncharacterized protein YjbI with pentapeptide repeats